MTFNKATQNRLPFDHLPRVQAPPPLILGLFLIKIFSLFLLGLGAFAFQSLPAFGETDPASNPDYSTVKNKLITYIHQQMNRDHVKGLSLALVDGDTIVWAEGFGLADVQNKIPATADTLYRADSVSKILTATEVMRLIEQGKLGLDEPLKKAIPGFSIHNRFKRAKPITIRALLAHHSGMPTAYHQGMWTDNPGTLAGLVNDLKQDYLVAPPQTFYKYSNIDYSLLGRVIELKTKRPFAEAMQKNLLAPLGMNASTFEIASLTDNPIAKGYDDGKEIPLLFLRDTPAQGLFTSANDMALFLRFLCTDNPPLLRRKNLTSMFKEQFPGIPLDFGHQIGLGWMLNGLGMRNSNDLVWHDGDYGPYFCRLALLTKEKLGVVVLSNTMESHVMGRELALRALKLMREAKTGVPADLDKPKTVMPKLVKVPDEKLQHYVGFYSGIGKAARVWKDGSQLKADLMDHQFELVPTSENKFIPQITVLFFPIHLPEYTLEFTTVSGKEVIILGGLGDPLVFEKIKTAEIPEAWSEWLGKYNLDNPDGQTQFKKMTLEYKNGLLTFNAKITSRVFNVTNTDYQIALEPISDTDAIVSGLVFPDGDTVHVSQENSQVHLYYAGLKFTKVPAHP